MKNTLIWVSNKEIIENFGLKNKDHMFTIFESDVDKTEFAKIAKEMKRASSDKIIKINNDHSFEVIYKKNSVWTSVKFDDLITNWMIFTNSSPKKIKDFKLPDLLNNKKETLISFPYSINSSNAEDFKEVLLFYLEDGSLGKTAEMEGKSFATINVNFEVETREYFDKFSNDIVKGNLRGISKISAERIGSNLLSINTKFGQIFAEIREDRYIRIYSVLSSAHKDIAELFSFVKGMKANVATYIKNDEILTNVPRKITKRNLATWTLALMIVILLALVTFSLVFKPKNIGMAFEIMSSPFTWSQPWIYMMWINFIISIFLAPIIAIIFIKALNPGKKIDFKQQSNIFISAQIRMVVVFLTGNALLATIIWGWYLNSTRNLRISSFVGMVASVNIVRGLVIIPIGSLFMIRGTIFNHTIFEELGAMSTYYLYVSMSWIGWIWHTLEHLALTLLFVVPPLHILWNKITLFRYRKETNSNIVIDNFTNFEMNLVNLKSSMKNIFKNKDRLYRVITAMIVVIFIETFEFTFSLNMVENFALENGYISSKASYWNIFAISGVRYMSSFVYNFPLIRLIPGQGMGFTDVTLYKYTTGIINHAHNGDIPLDTVDDLSRQTTFIIRFFNFYLKRVIALVISAIMIPLAIHKRNIKYKEVLK